MVYLQLQRCLLVDIAGVTLNCCRLGAFRGHHATMRHMSCHFMQSHIRRVHAYLGVTCHLHLWQNDLHLLRGTDIEIRVSTESWPWKRTFSRRSCRDSNPRPFDHESGALTTELFPLPRLRLLDFHWPSRDKQQINAYRATGSAKQIAILLLVRSGTLCGFPDSTNVVSAATLRSNHTWCRAQKESAVIQKFGYTHAWISIRAL